MKANMALKKRSTELAVLELIDRITQSLDHGQTPVNIYLDLSKAFDTSIEYYYINCRIMV